jgi:bromodomain-containing factor 1
VRLDLPTYPKIVKKPMDFSTMKKKLEAHEYNSAQKFYDDFKLMIRNCFAFNPPGTPVNQAGVELQRLFDEKWKGLPPFHDGSDDEYDEEENGSDYDETARESLAILFAP